jgi:hypothetical protein
MIERRMIGTSKGSLKERIPGKCKGNLTDLRRILHLSLAKGNPKRTL